MENIKKNREIDLFDFTSFLVWTFLIFWPTVCCTLALKIEKKVQFGKFTQIVIKVKINVVLKFA